MEVPPERKSQSVVVGSAIVVEDRGGGAFCGVGLTNFVGPENTFNSYT